MKNLNTMNTLRAATVAVMAMASGNAVAEDGVSVTPRSIQEAGCVVPTGMSLLDLRDGAAALEQSFEHAVHVSAQDRDEAYRRAVLELQESKKSLSADTGRLITSLSVTADSARELLRDIPANAQADAFEDTGKYGLRLAEIEKSYGVKKQQFSGLTDRYDSFEGITDISDDGIKLYDVAVALKAWEKSTGIDCPDKVVDAVIAAGTVTIPSYADPNAVMPLSQGLGTRGRGSGYGHPDFSSRSERNPDGSALTHEQKRLNALYDFLGKVERLESDIAKSIEAAEQLQKDVDAFQPPAQRQ